MDRYMNVGGKFVKIGSWVMLPDGDVIWVACNEKFPWEIRDE